MACPTLVPSLRSRGGALRAEALIAVLRGLLSERQTGILRVCNSDQDLRLRLVNGQLVSASGSHDRIGEILVRRGHLDPAQLGPALAEAWGQGRRLGQVLCERGLVRREHLEEALLIQIRDALHRALSWREGAYEFAPDDGPTLVSEDITLAVSTEELLREAERQPPASEAVGEHRRQILRAFERLDGKSHFDVLGVSRQAGPEEIKAAYVALARRFHPDALSDPALAEVKNAAAAVFRRVNEAYNALRAQPSRCRGSELRNAPRPAAAAPPPPVGPRIEPAPVPDPPPAAPPLRALDDLVREGEEHLVRGRLWEASLAFEEVLSRGEGRMRRRAQLLLARAYAKSPSGSKRAETELRSLIAEDDGCAEAHLALAQLYREKALPTRAAEAYRKVLSLEPRHARAAQELAALAPASDGRGLLERFRPRSR